jgi:hypothetical protein
MLKSQGGAGARLKPGSKLCLATVGAALRRDEIDTAIVTILSRHKAAPTASNERSMKVFPHFGQQV